MRLGLCRWSGQGTARRFRCSLCIVLMTAALTVATTCCVADEPVVSNAGVATVGPNADQPVLRYLPDDCRVYGHFKIAPIMASEFVRNLKYAGANPVDVFSLPLAPIGLEVNEIERVFFGARQFTNDSLSQYVAILFCKKPVDLASSCTQCNKTEVGGHTIYGGRNGAPAFCAVEDEIVLVGELDTIRVVLQRGRPARLPDTQDTSWTITRSSSQLAVSMLPPAGNGWAQFQSLPLADGVLNSVKAIGMEVTFEKDLKVRISALCGDEKAAEQINSIVTGLSALALLQDFESQIPQYREFVDSVQCDCEDCVVTAEMTVPGGLVQVGSISNPNLIGQTQSGPVEPPGVVGSGVPVPPWANSPYAPFSPTPNCEPYRLSPPPTGYASPYAPVTGYRNSTHSPTVRIADVIRLIEAGVADAVIVRFVRNHRLEAHLTVDDLILLTSHEADPEIILMLQDLPVVRKPHVNQPVPVPSPNRCAPPPPDRSTKQGNDQAAVLAYPYYTVRAPRGVPPQPEPAQEFAQPVRPPQPK